jgi:hypothetical protein
MDSPGAGRAREREQGDHRRKDMSGGFLEDTVWDYYSWYQKLGVILICVLAGGSVAALLIAINYLLDAR